MFVLGLVSLIQMAFLPGFLLTYGFNLCRGHLRTLTCSFLLSALANYYLVSFCLILGVYTSTVIYSVFIVEVLILLFLLHSRAVIREVRPHATHESSFSVFEHTLQQRALRFSDVLLEPTRLLALSALALIAFAGCEVVSRFGDIFVLGDAINSWNPWAMQMAQNQWPNPTMLYPQLLPANFSINYVFLKETHVWFFSKAWVSLFFPMLLFSMYSLYRCWGEWEVLLALILTFLLFYRIMIPKLVYGGIADIALATFAFNSIHALLYAARTHDGATQRRELILGALFAAGCALTKQGGLFLLVAYPVLCVAVMRGTAGNHTPKRHEQTGGKFVAAICLVPLIAAIPWYIWELYEIAIGTDRSLVGALTVDLHQGRSIFTRLVHAAHVLDDRLGHTLSVGILISSCLALVTPDYRWITLVVPLPYLTLWALGFSYDHRNASLAIPFIAMSSAFGFGVFLGHCQTLFTRIGARERAIKITACVGLILLAVWGFNHQFSEGRLVKHQKKKLINTLGRVGTNVQLIEYFRKAERPGLVLTNFPTIRWIPTLEDKIHKRCLRRKNDINRCLQELRDPLVQYVLVLDRTLRENLGNYLKAAVETGELQVIFDEGPFTFYRKLQPPRPETLKMVQATVRERASQ